MKSKKIDLSNVSFQLASVADIPQVLALHKKYQINTINENDKQDGFITTDFSMTQLEKLILDEKGLFIARLDSQVIAYAMSASWMYWSQWPIFCEMIKQLDNIYLLQTQLTLSNSYQYGPVCVDKDYRGTGVFEKIFNFALDNMSNRFLIMATFINNTNQRSLSAHFNKLKLNKVSEFEFNHNHYSWAACFTS